MAGREDLGASCVADSPCGVAQSAPLTWALSFEAKAGERLNRYGLGVTVMGGPSRWWIKEQRRWVSDDERRALQLDASSHAPARTLKAFRRHLRRHAESLLGCEVVWANRFQGCDVSAHIAP